MKKISTLLAILAMAIIAPLSANAAWSGYKIMLDPGHGGSDPGAAGPRAPHEAALALRCANSIVSWLKSNGCAYRMTRSSDVYVSLSARRSASVSYDPYIFCSIHLNAFNGSAHGTETWYYWSGGNSRNLANKVQATLVQQLGRTNRGVKQNGWTVITGSSSVPAILTEALFVDNSTEWGMINETGKSGFKAWVNGHLYGFYDFGTGVQGKSLTPNPRSGGSTTPDPTPANPTLTVSTTSLHFTCSVGEKPTLSFTVKGTNLSSNISVSSRTPGRFSTSVTSLPKTGGTVTVTFANADKVGTYGEGGTANNYKFLIAVTNGSLRKEVIITAEVKAPPLSLKEGWNLSEKSGKKDSKGYDASKIRNFCYNNGKLYCVYNHSDIKVIDAQTGKDLGNLKKGEVVTGGTLTLCDVKALDGHIIACNLAASGQKLRIYEWANDNALPTLVMETDNFQNASRLGDCIELTGKYPSDYWIAFGNENNKQTRIIEYHMKNNSCVEAKNTPVYREDKTTNLSTMATVRAYPLGGNWWIDGKDSYPTYVVQENGKAYRKTFVDTGESWGSCHHEFYWGGQKYSANLVFNGKEYIKGTETMDPDKNYKGARMRLVQDLTGDFKRMQQVGDFPSNGLGDTSRNTNATGDIIVRTDGTNWLEAWVLSTTHGMAYYVHGTAPKTEGQPIQSEEPMIAVDKTSLDFSAKQGQTDFKEVTVSGSNLKDVINLTLSGANADMFSLSSPSLSTPGKFKVTYSPKAEGNHTATLTISSQGAANVTVTLKGTGKATITLKEDIAGNTDRMHTQWVYSTNKNNTPSWTTFDASQSANRDIALIGSKLYVLNSKNWGTPAVNILNAEDASYKGTLSVDDLASATGKLGGLAVADGKLIASNIVTDKQNLRVYIWDNDAAKPRVLVQKDAAGIITGGSVAFSGTLSNGRVWLTKQGANEVIYFEIKNGSCDNNMHTIALKDASGKAYSYGEDGRGASKIYPNADGSFWMVQKDNQIAKFDASGKITDEILPAAALGGSRYGTAFAPFSVGNKKYIAAVTYKTGNIGNGQIAIIDVTNGIAKATAPIMTLPEEGFGSVNNVQFASTVIASAGGDLNGNISLYVNVHNQGIGRFLYEGESKDAISDIINIEDADADAEYYNLQGIRVAADNLTTGVYIRRQGNKAEKVYVK